MFIHCTRNHQQHIREYRFPYLITPRLIGHHRPMRDQERNILSILVPVDFGMLCQGINLKEANEQLLGCCIEGMSLKDNVMQINLFSSKEPEKHWGEIEEVLSRCFCLEIKELVGT